RLRNENDIGQHVRGISMNTAKSVEAAHEILGKVEGLKSYIRGCKTAGTLDHYEYSELLKPLLKMDIVSRGIVKDKERIHEQGGGTFNVPVAPKMEISQANRGNVYKR